MHTIPKRFIKHQKVFEGLMDVFITLFMRIYIMGVNFPGQVWLVSHTLNYIHSYFRVAQIIFEFIG
ncbi:hypothetical protein JCM12294_46180 [Desulfocicer niacini]